MVVEDPPKDADTLTAPPDGCPDCLARDNYPHSSILVGNAIVGAYCCRVCGHRWVCNWLVRCLG